MLDQRLPSGSGVPYSLNGEGAMSKESRQNKLSDSMPREDGVVPLAMELVPPDGQLLHLLVTHLPTCRIVARVQLRADGQPALRPRVPDQVHHHLTAHQGATPPVLG